MPTTDALVLEKGTYMQNEIDKWLEDYGDDARFAEPARFIRQLQEERQEAQRQAVANLRIAAEEMRTLAERFSPSVGGA